MNYSYVIDILLSFAGGVLGAAIGGVYAFMLCGLSFLGGTIINIFSAHPSPDIIISWGPFLGPHVAFAGGVATAAFAASRKKLESGRDIVTMLWRLRSPMVYCIGGLFGVIGFAIKTFLDLLPAVNGIPPVNSITFSIVVTGLLVRLFYGNTGVFTGMKAKFVSWQPWNVGSSLFMFLAAIVAVVSSVVVHYYPATFGLMLGIAAFSLLFLLFGMKIPVVLHVAWAAEYVAFITGDIGWGIAAGILTGLIGELCGNFFLVNGDTHIDPPAMSLAVVLSLFPLLVMAGSLEVLKSYSLIAAFTILVCSFGILRFLEKRTMTNSTAVT